MKTPDSFRLNNADTDWDALRPFARGGDLHIIEAMLEHKGNAERAAKSLGRSLNSVLVCASKMKRRAVMSGFLPQLGMNKPLPDPLVLKGVSVMVDENGNPKGTTWVKANIHQEAYNEAVRGAIAEFISDQPRVVAPPPPRDYSTDVVPWIQIGDAHIGMLAHAAEVGEDFDIKIGERELCGAIAQLIDEMPACEVAVINDLGDGTHYENFRAMTEASGNVLDFDTRFPKMVESYARIMRFIVDKTLTKAKRVDVIINQGNHSQTNDIWLGILLRAVYDNDRVNVLDNRDVFIGYRMGNTLVMVHHGHKCKFDNLSKVLTRDFKQDFGETDYHYVDMGHVHHKHVALDVDGIQVESWNTLAPHDRWAHDAGYRASKSISVVLRSRTYGEIGRRTLSLREVRDRLYGKGNHPSGKRAFQG